MIDSIEHNVAKAGGYVEDAKQNVNNALIKRKQAIRVKNLIQIKNIVYNLVCLLEKNYFNCCYNHSCYCCSSNCPAWLFYAKKTFRMINCLY
jgi:hypothetical protein